MAETVENQEPTKDETFVTVELKEEKNYRPTGQNDAIYIGPGNVEVPTWVAQEWGLVSKPDSDKPDSDKPDATSGAGVPRTVPKK